MPSGFTETNIYQFVLDRLVEQAILSTTDDTATARWLSRNYPLQRDLLLQKHPWNFAITRAVLAEDSIPPAFEFAHSYTKPPDCLRLLPITCDGRRNSPQVEFVVEGDQILTNMPAPLKVNYIKRETDPGQFSPMFINLLVHILASAYAYTLTGKAALAKSLSDSLGPMTGDAQLVDALEGLPVQPDDSDVISVR